MRKTLKARDGAVLHFRVWSEGARYGGRRKATRPRRRVSTDQPPPIYAVHRETAKDDSGGTGLPRARDPAPTRAGSNPAAPQRE